MNSKVIMMRNLLIIICGCLLLVSCSTTNPYKSSQAVPVQKGAPVVYIHPFSANFQQAKVGVLPFAVPPNVSDQQGLEVSALFKEVLLGKRTFKVVKQITVPYGDLANAVDIGRQSDVDLVLAGRINYVLAGTEMGGARVEVSVRLLEVKSGNTVWYIEQAMDQDMDYPSSAFFSRLANALSMPTTRPAAGPPAVPNMLATIAVDMADVMTGAQTVSR